MAFIPDEIPRIEPEPVARVWGAYCGDQAYGVEVTVLPRAFNLPAEWMTFQFEPTGDDTEVTSANFVAATGPLLATQGLELMSAVATPIDAERYQEIAAEAQARAEANGDAPLTTIARPNRAARRAMRVRGA